ncbi:2-dehydropantoate 2-reductase [Idiomarina seosinensis]|uniref:ketopantoate reductase family protein n=1 Tax=Idiomarina seosinensis TaxID=281739 RepID=UPI0038515183
MKHKPLRWLVFGPGAISGLISAGLVRQQHAIAFITRNTGATDLITWQIHDKNGLQSFETPTYQHQWQPDAVIMAVKSYDIGVALAALDNLGISSECPIILSHNGIVQQHSKRPLFTMITTHAATRRAYQIQHTGNGASWLANYAENCSAKLQPPIAQAMVNSFAPLQLVDDITQRRWYKLLINCIINPLTAIYRVPNGELAKDRYQPLIAALIDEFLAVSALAGYPFKATDARQAVYQVIDDTRQNRSSMLTDIEHGRPTEIAALNGYLINQAECYDVEVPNHRWVLTQITRK